jgi:hypothetical protein
MYADKMALSQLAEAVGEHDSAEAFRAEAEALRSAINQRLWNDHIGMFGTISEEGEPRDVREQVGYIPWMYGIPDAGKDGCFRYLLDKNCFLAPYGLRTADASHPEYRKPFPHECLWNGPVWPFATSQTLTALIAYLQTEKHPVVKAEDFLSLLLTYAHSHRDTDGTPWLDENLDPDTGIWIAREILRQQTDYEIKDRGRHYNHSTFIDNVLNGLIGIRPAEDGLTVAPLVPDRWDYFCVEGVSWRGKRVTVRYDKNGDRYGCGKGFCVTVDGEVAFLSDKVEAVTVGKNEGSTVIF